MRLAMDSKLIRLFAPLVVRSLAKSHIPEGVRFYSIQQTVPTYVVQKFRWFSSSNAQNDAKSEADQNINKQEDSEVEKKLRTELNKAVSENATLLSSSREFEDKYLRALAETENLRTRLTKQINDSKLYAVQGFCKDMTEISDILRMAIDSVPKDQISGENPHLKNLFDGLTMTETRLMQVFKSHGLVQLNPIDEKFNPNEHEAVVHQPVDGKASGTVIFVSKLGYKLHERVIRPAVVGVAK